MNLSRKNLIEKDLDNNKVGKATLDEFDKDALEGWEKLTIEDLNNLDRRYIGKPFLIKLSLPILFLGAFIISIVAFESTIKETREIKFESKTNTKTNRKTATYIPINLPKEEIVLIAHHKQVQPRKIQGDFKEKNKHEEIPIIKEYDERRNTEITITPKSIEKIYDVNSTNLAEEVFIQDLLVIDYRHYRKRDPIKLKTELTGTPANLAQKSKEDELINELDISYMNFLSKTLKLFNKKSFQEAIINFEIILSKYPDDVNALFYESIALYNLGINNEAIRRLKQLELAPYSNFQEEQQWYLLLCYKADKQQELFNTLRSKIIKSKGYYWMRAQQLDF